MPQQYSIDFDFPAVDQSSPANLDIATRRLTVEAPGLDSVTKDYPVADLNVPIVSDAYIFDQDVSVTLTGVDIDAHGNESPSTVTVVPVTDDVSPNAPGSFTIHSKTPV